MLKIHDHPNLSINFCLLYTSQGLGGDQATQQTAFVYIQKTLSHGIQTAAERQKQKTKLYRTSGVLCGLLLVVLFY